MHHRWNLTEDIKHYAQFKVPGVEFTFTDDMSNIVLIVIKDKVIQLDDRELTSFGFPRIVQI